jgi:hypothetical protein
LASAEERFDYFMHTLKETVWALWGVFGKFNGEDRIISKGLWPPRSPELNPRHLWKKLKSVVYANNPHDIHAIKQNIRELIYNN